MHPISVLFLYLQCGIVALNTLDSVILIVLCELQLSQ